MQAKEAPLSGLPVFEASICMRPASACLPDCLRCDDQASSAQSQAEMALVLFSACLSARLAPAAGSRFNRARVSGNGKGGVANPREMPKDFGLLLSFEFWLGLCRANTTDGPTGVSNGNRLWACAAASIRVVRRFDSI